MTPTTMSGCLDLLYDMEPTMSFTTSTTAALQAITREVSMRDLSQSHSASDTSMSDASSSSSFSQSREEIHLQDDVVRPKEETELIHTKEANDVIVPNEASDVPREQWKQFLKNIPFLAVPPEIHLKIIGFLNPIDSTCLSLVNRYLYNLSPPYLHRYPMDIGAPFSTAPCPQPDGCRHCCPVLYHPAHCELHYHLRSSIPREFKFCSGKCGKYTRCEQAGYSDSHEVCGECGTNYRRRYERGRRMLDMMRPGEKQLRLNKWYNSASAA